MAIFKFDWKFTWMLLLSIFFTPLMFSQNGKAFPNETEQRIKKVENNLISWVKLDSTANWNIFDRMKTLHINGVSIAVINNYKIDWAKGYGMADTLEKRPVTAETLFQAASIGKSLNGFAFMKLAQDGKIDLSSDINHYLKSWKFPYDAISDNNTINMAAILSHTAGLTVHGFDGYKWDQPIPNRIQILNGTPPANNPPVRSELTPGLKFEYSGGGYEISEQLLEDVTYSSYESYITNTIFEPLGMTNSFYTTVPPVAFTNRLATAYRADSQPIGCKYHLYPEKACGAGLWTTATDLARFVIEVQMALAGKSNKIINKETAETMITPYIQNSTYGMGFFIDKKAEEYYFQHSGLNEGFSSQFYGSFKNGNGVVVLVNSDNTGFMHEVINSVATVYGWKEFYPHVKKSLYVMADSILDKYVGQYKFENSDNGPKIIKADGSLYLQDPNSSDRWKMYFTTKLDFFMLEALWANQQFITDKKGKITGFYILGENYKSRGYKVE